MERNEANREPWFCSIVSKQIENAKFKFVVQFDYWNCDATWRHLSREKATKTIPRKSGDEEK